MRKIFLFLCLFWSVHVEAQFIPQTEDIPLMSGINLTDSSVFSFDTPSGQILTIDGQTKLAQKDIVAFYAQTLATMGWHKEKENTYTRGSDTLAISFPSTGVVHFDITLTSRN